MMIPMIIDVDGTLTDCTVGYPEKSRQFNLRDGHGIQLLKEKTNIRPIVMSGECDESILARVDKLKVLHYLSVPNKYEYINEFHEGFWPNISFEKYIAISDDIMDIPLLENATVAFCPSDAEHEVKAISGIVVLDKKGGKGCVREAVNMILTQPWITDVFKGALQIK